jgi:hypothetical protein
MSSSSGVMVSHDQVEKWETEADEYENRAKSLRRKIDAARIILDTEAEIEAEEVEEEGVLIEETENPTENNFMGTINRIVNAQRSPISKSYLKQLLRNEGFPTRQVDGTYFYVAIRKLDGAGRITTTKSGLLGKGTRE